MKEQFLPNLIFLLFVNLLIKPFYVFGIDRTVQNVVGTDNYGEFASFYSFSLLFYILMDLGLTQSNNRNVARDPSKMEERFSSFLFLKIGLAFFYFCFTLLIAYFSDYGFPPSKLLLILLLNQVLLSFILYFRSNISGLHLFRADALLSITDKVIMIVICGALLWGSFLTEFTIEHFVWSQFFAYVTTIIIAFLVNLYYSRSFSFSFNWALCKSLIKESLPFALLVLLMTIYYRVDTVMIERLLISGKEEAGIYAACFRILDAFSNFSLLFGVLLLPIFSRMIKEKEPVEGLMLNGLKIIYAFSITLAITCFFYQDWVIQLLYYEGTEYWSQVFGLLMVGFIPLSTSYIFGALLAAKGELKTLNIISISGVVLNIGLNYFLIPKYGALGAGATTLLTQFLVTGLQFFWCYKVFKMQFLLKNLTVFILFPLLAVVTSYTMRFFQEDSAYSFLMVLLITALFSILLRLIDIRSWMKILKTKFE